MGKVVRHARPIDLGGRGRLVCSVPRPGLGFERKVDTGRIDEGEVGLDELEVDVAGYGTAEAALALEAELDNKAEQAEDVEVDLPSEFPPDPDHKPGQKV